MYNVAKLCRLCCQDCDCGHFDIFAESEEKASLVILINKYLPIKVDEDDMLPKQICESCHIGVATTVDLIDRMVEGQQRLRALCSQFLKELGFKNKAEQQKLWENDIIPKSFEYACDNDKNLNKDLFDYKILGAEGGNGTLISNKYDVKKEQLNEIAEKKLKNLEKLGLDQVEQTALENKKSDYRPTTQALINIQGRTPDIEMNDLAKGTNVKKIYESHPLCLAMEGIQKKKRGRRRLDSNSKCKTTYESNNNINSDIDGVNSIASNRPKRKTNIPTRYRDSVAGKEFDEIIPEDTLNDHLSAESSINGLKIDIEKHNIEFSEFNFLNKEEEKTHILEDTTVIVTSNHRDDVLLKLPAAVNIELDFNEKSLITKDCDGNSIASIDHTPKASIQTVESIPKVEFLAPKIPAEVQEDWTLQRKASLLNDHKRKLTKVKKFKKFSCEFCCKMFVHEGRYLHHLKLHNEVILICETCNEEFTQSTDLKLHQKSTGHTGVGVLENEIIDNNKIFKCLICPERKFFSKARYEKHLKVIHGGKKPFPCPLCPKSYVTEQNRLSHYSVCHRAKKVKRFPCLLCGKAFTLQSSLTYHMDSVHFGGRKFVCKICSKAFKHKQLLQRHYYVHSDERPHICLYCKKAFKTKGNLDNHMNLHTNSKVFNCDFCGKQFNHMTALTQHRRMHTGEKPYECTYCGKRFAQRGNYQEHLRIHTGEKPFGCQECGKHFTTSSQIRLHQIRHRKDHKFRCSYCPKGFYNQEMWLSHEAKHVGEKKLFTCSTCSKSFSEKNSYQRHLKSHLLTMCHLGDKNTYECAMCNKQFFNSSLCIKHMMKHCDLKGDAMRDFIEHQPELNMSTVASSNPDIIYVLAKKDDNELEYITFDNEIFTSNQNQTVVENLPAGVSISHLPSSFICEETPEMSGGSGQLDEENANSAFEITLKEQSMFI